MSKTTFSDGNKSQGIPGTRVLAAFLNLIFNHRHTGINDDGHAPLDYASDTGSANAYVISLTPALASLVNGMPVYFKAANTNTGASTLKIGSLAATGIRLNGQALAAGQILASQIYAVLYDGAYFQLITNPGDLITISNAVTTPTANKVPKYNANGIIKGTELNMTGLDSATSSTDTCNLSMTATNGDVLLVFCGGNLSGTLGSNIYGSLSAYCGGVACHVSGRGGIANYAYGLNSSSIAQGFCCFLIEVQADGTLSLTNHAYQTGGSTTYSNFVTAFFLKKA